MVARRNRYSNLGRVTTYVSLHELDYGHVHEEDSFCCNVGCHVAAVFRAVSDCACIRCRYHFTGEFDLCVYDDIFFIDNIIYNLDYVIYDVNYIDNCCVC